MANFTLSEKEQEAATKFIKKHKHHNELGLFDYIFTPTGIGDAVHIRCPHCGQEKDITDVGCW